RLRSGAPPGQLAPDHLAAVALVASPAARDGRHDVQPPPAGGVHTHVALNGDAGVAVEHLDAKAPPHLGDGQLQLGTTVEDAVGDELVGHRGGLVDDVPEPRAG